MSETIAAPSPTPQDRIRIVVVDDHTLFRRGLTALLARVPDFEVVGEARTRSTAFERRWRPAPTSCFSTCTCRAFPGSRP